jgi:hypothetical protein
MRRFAARSESLIAVWIMHVHSLVVVDDASKVVDDTKRAGGVLPAWMNSVEQARYDASCVTEW